RLRGETVEQGGAARHRAAPRIGQMPEDNPQLEAMQAEPDGGAIPPEFAEQLPEKQYCVFRAGRERFCLLVLDVEEVVEWPRVTRVPLAPAFLVGVFNLRGAI